MTAPKSELMYPESGKQRPKSWPGNPFGFFEVTPIAKVHAFKQREPQVPKDNVLCRQYGLFLLGSASQQAWILQSLQLWQREAGDESTCEATCLGLPVVPLCFSFLGFPY